jgi:hypothetical protein
MGLALTAGLGVATAGGETRDKQLPLTGETTSGERWRLEAGHPSPGDDVRSSWCLQLRYTSGTVIDGDPFSAGSGACGRGPARRVSGQVDVDCRLNLVFIYGGTRSRVRSLVLHTRRGAPVSATWAELPPRSGFEGRSFVLVSDVRRFPGRLLARGAGQRQIVRVPGKATLCEPYPGAPDGGGPFASFESRK